MNSEFYEQMPWLTQYTSKNKTIDLLYPSVVHAFQELLSTKPDLDLIKYFDCSLNVKQYADIASALSKTLIKHGFKAGDRLGLYAQNDPAFMYALLAVWSIGGIVVPINPMNKAKELQHIVNDAQIKAILALDYLYEEHAKEVVQAKDSPVSILITYAETDDQSENDKNVFIHQGHVKVDGALDLRDIVNNAEAINKNLPELPELSIKADDIALLTYTSGTTGSPKGAMNTHANVLFNSCAYRDWCDLDHNDVNLAIAPLFHITGVISHGATTMLTGNTLVITHRFHPETMLNAIRRFRPTYTIGSITAFISFMNSGLMQKGDFDSFKAILSGGAPVPAATADQFEALTGKYIHNAYGMTETCSISFIVPVGKRAPIDESSGALSIGVPIFNTTLKVLLEDGSLAEPNQEGELAVKGPQLMKGYWNQPEKTKQTIKDGYILSGDVGFVDEQGWFFLIDRKKDMIIASGYKVWPRDVEDTMYGHPAVQEVAVIGVQDPYRGETVKAVISLKKGQHATAEELIAYGKEHLPSYKYPRIIEFMDDLPKTNTGKILRRQLK